MSEQKLQERIARYLDRRRLLWFHPPNGGARSRRAGAALKKAGAKRGVPDIIILEPTEAGAPGMAIELKWRSGSLSPHQERWLEQLKKRGWVVAVCRGYGEACDLIEEHYGR